MKSIRFYQYTLWLLGSLKISHFWLVVIIVIPSLSLAQLEESDKANALKNLEQTQQRQTNFLRNIEGQKEQKLREKDNLNIEIESSKAQKPISNGNKEICFDIKSIHLTGATILKGKEWNKIVKKYTGLCIGVTQVNELIRQITNFYIDKGYTTSRAVIPEQDLKTGELEVLVIEGVVEDIILNENNLRDRLTIAMAFPFTKGKILNLRNIEQGLEQINRMASSAAKIQLLPGEKRGGTKIVITNKVNKPNRASVGYDNSGQVSTGKDKELVSLERDNLFGFGETWSVNFNENITGQRDIKNSQIYSANFSLPFGYWTFSQNLSHSQYLQTISGSNQTFKASGETNNSTSKIEHVVFRSKDTKLSLSSGLKLKNTKAFIEDVASSSGTYALTIANAGVDYTIRALGAIFSFAGGYERGLKEFGAKLDRTDVTSDTPHAQFNKYTADANIYKPLSIRSFDIAVRSNISAQYSNSTLFSSERISIGDRYTVRGFQENSLSGERGIYTRNELIWNMPQLSQNKYINSLVSLQPYIGVDMGKVLSVSDGAAGTLSGWATGLRNNSDYLSFDLTYSEKLTSPTSVVAKDNEIYCMVVARVGF